MDNLQARKLGEEYQALPAEKRQEYKDNAALEMARFMEKQAQYKKEHPESVNGTSKESKSKREVKKNGEASKKSSVPPPNPQPLPPAVDLPAINGTHVVDDSVNRSNKKKVGRGDILNNGGSSNEKKSKKKGKNEEAKKKSPAGQQPPLPPPPPPPVVKDTHDKDDSEIISSDVIFDSGRKKKEKKSKKKRKSKKKNEASVVNDTNVEHDPAEGIHEKKIDSDGILHQGENEQKPKRPLNTYQLYANEVRGKVKAANPDLSGMEIVSIVLCSYFFCVLRV